MAMTMGQLATKLAQAAQKVGPVSERKLDTLAQAGVGLMKREIQNVHAVDTGTMLNSTTAERSGRLEYLIGPTVNYAVYVALGTSRVEARPFHITSAKKLSKLADEIMTSEDLGL